jgi:hypothetical protein
MSHGDGLMLCVWHNYDNANVSKQMANSQKIQKIFSVSNKEYDDSHILGPSQSQRKVVDRLVDFDDAV